MANSNGIDYFSFNVDFFDDDKLALIEGEFGIKGAYIAIRLLCKIYKKAITTNGVMTSVCFSRGKWVPALLRTW